jgi:heptaprenyl diphosphate synthase
MRLRKILIIALFTSLALVVNVIEGLLPMPLPGVKLGAANVFALTALLLFGTRAAFAVTLLRVLLGWLVSGNPFAFACSISGGLLSTAVMALLYTRYEKYFSVAWVSVGGAWAFNIGQVAAVALLVGSADVFYYLPLLLVVGSAAGWAVGALAAVLAARMKKIIEIGGTHRHENIH